MIFTVHEKEIFSGSSLGRLRGKGAEEEKQTFSCCGCPFFFGGSGGGLPGPGLQEVEKSSVSGKEEDLARGARRGGWQGHLRTVAHSSRNAGWEGDPTKTAGPAGVSIAWGGKVPVGEGVGFLWERPRIYYKHQGRGSVVLWTRTNSSPRISPAGWARNSGAHPKTQLGGGLVLCLLCCFMGF